MSADEIWSISIPVTKGSPEPPLDLLESFARAEADEAGARGPLVYRGRHEVDPLLADVIAVYHLFTATRGPQPEGT